MVDVEMTMTVRVLLPVVTIDEAGRVEVHGTVPLAGWCQELERELLAHILGKQAKRMGPRLTLGALWLDPLHGATEALEDFAQRVLNVNVRRCSAAEVMALRTFIRRHDHEARRGVPTRYARWLRWSRLSWQLAEGAPS